MLLQCQWTVKRRWDPNHVLRAQQRDIHRRDCCQLHICSLGASTPALFDPTLVGLLGKDTGWFGEVWMQNRNRGGSRKQTLHRRKAQILVKFKWTKSGSGQSIAGKQNLKQCG